MGFVLIFNNETFDIENVSDRKNSRKDVLMLKNVFYKFDYRIKIVMDPKLEDIRKTMNESLPEYLKAANCLVVVLMTHGLENDNAYAKDKIYNIGEEILESKAFRDFKSLPKIFITQACKNIDNDFKPNIESKTHTVFNTFRFNSCFEGGKSARGDQGSLFIKRLCNGLNKFGLNDDIEEIAERILLDFEKEYKKIGIKQSPTIERCTEGFQKFCFGEDVKNAYSVVQEARNFIKD